MSATTRGLIHVVLAVVLGGGAAWGAVEAFTSWRDHQIATAPFQELPDPGTRLQKAIDAVKKDGVYVSPDGRGMVDAAGERTLEKAVAATNRPVHVIVWAPSGSAGDRLRVDDQLERAFDGQDALFYVWEGPEEGDVISVGRELDFYESRAPDDVLRSEYDFVGEPAPTLAAAVRATNDLSWDEPYDEDTGGSVVGGIALGAAIALGALALIWGLGLGIRAASKGRLRVPGGWTWTKGADRG